MKNKIMQELTNIIALAIGNNIDEANIKYLTDEQMKELNHLIRDAVYTILSAVKEQGKSDIAKEYLESYIRNIPLYWEDCKITEDYKRFEQNYKGALKKSKNISKGKK